MQTGSFHPGGQTDAATRAANIQGVKIKGIFWQNNDLSLGGWRGDVLQLKDSGGKWHWSVRTSINDTITVEILTLIALCAGVPQGCGLGPHEVPVRNLYLYKTHRKTENHLQSFTGWSNQPGRRFFYLLPQDTSWLPNIIENSKDLNDLFLRMLGLPGSVCCSRPSFRPQFRGWAALSRKKKSCSSRWHYSSSAAQRKSRTQRNHGCTVTSQQSFPALLCRLFSFYLLSLTPSLYFSPDVATNVSYYLNPIIPELRESPLEPPTLHYVKQNLVNRHCRCARGQTSDDGIPSESSRLPLWNSIKDFLHCVASARRCKKITASCASHRPLKTREY